MNVVADKNQDNRMKKYIKIIKKSSESLLRTINDIIDSSKLKQVTIISTRKLKI